MADQQLLEMLTRMDATLTQQGVMMATLAAQASTVDARFASGEVGVQVLVAALEARLADTETRTTAALEARLAATETRMAEAMVALSASLDQRLVVMQQMAVTMTSAAAAAQMPAPAAAAPTVPAQPSTGDIPPASAAGFVPKAGAAQFDPWATYSGTAAAQPPGLPEAGRSGGTQHFQLYGGEGLKTKDFTGIQAFDGDLTRFADWADRMSAKMSRGHPQLAAMLAWAERQEDPISLAVEQGAVEPGVDVVGISGAVFDVLMERTGSRLFDKRRNAGSGRGLEFWRILKRDFGTESANAQKAKLQMYFMPARCTSVNLLGDALDKWEALGREINRPIDEDFRLIALQQLVPKSVADMMATQASLAKFPEAIMFVRRQVADHRHANQVQVVQRQSPVAMDVSAVLAAIAHWGGEVQQHEAPWQDPEADPGHSDLDCILAAIKGRGKGKGKGDVQGKGGGGGGENRECYNCGTRGHLSRDCPAPQRAKGDAKGNSKGTKGKGKGKGWQNVHALTEGDGEAFSLACLVRAELPLSAVTMQQPEVWEDFEMIEALMDSGAGECVCGPQHFSGIEMTVDPNRAGAGTEYICADGGRIRNQGEKLVPGLSDEGSRMKINFQVTNVEKPLIAVSKLTAAGHDVWFGQQHGTITHGDTGKQTTFFKKNGVYVLRVWAPRARPASAPASSGGIRQ